MYKTVKDYIITDEEFKALMIPSLPMFPTAVVMPKKGLAGIDYFDKFQAWYASLDELSNLAFLREEINLLALEVSISNPCFETSTPLTEECVLSLGQIYAINKWLALKYPQGFIPWSIHRQWSTIERRRQSKFEQRKMSQSLNKSIGYIQP